MLGFIKKNKEIVLSIFVILLALYLYNDHLNSNSENFDNKRSKLMFFSATWCGHCNEFNPKWKKLVQHVNEDPNNRKYKYKVTLHKFDSDTKAHKVHFDKYNVKQFPTIIFEDRDGSTKEFKGDRSLEVIKNFLNENVD